MPLKHLEESWTLNSDALEYIHRAAERGLYESGAWAPAQAPTFDDLVFPDWLRSRGIRSRVIVKDA